MFLKRYNSFQNKYDMKDTYNFAPRHLIFKLQQEAFKFSYICVSWGSPKTGMERIFLQLENQECQLFAIETIEVNIQHSFLLTYFFL